ncbi:hypothetical protein PPL_01927 [Heterostelium album PN500]|uniref:GST C-terminal domain-containing protein n=1 Tax=Heterostelium pallidum (strain ATCC 26659 / Pp 5 / PN500) TaxID=670386 RepID=D3B0W0_HETP5|nr:hypothetical protein PPL_01927 [Heterostelium album PN500]EFA84934.1 hypothetical protein PPL_01927 [Heterostelium album PN500]|eukprot:XP_020437044.1 hypothetical protein PPL_01927 [Heterostelium album PN500]
MTTNTTTDNKKEFNREASKLRNWVKVGSDQFPPELDRYHLYANYTCPWVNRVLIVRKLKGLEHVISVSITEPRLDEKEGWPFNPEFDELTTEDSINHAKNIPELYKLSDANYQGRYSVPILWDKKKSVIVNNESSEIIRMLNSEFNAFSNNPQLNLLPSDLESEIDKINELIYENINNGVYKCGFAPTQEGYDIAFDKLFNTLELLEKRLDTNRYLLGDRFTEADVRLFPTLVRFDAAYYNGFKYKTAESAKRALESMTTEKKAIGGKVPELAILEDFKAKAKNGGSRGGFRGDRGGRGGRGGFKSHKKQRN